MSSRCFTSIDLNRSEHIKINIRRLNFILHKAYKMRKYNNFNTKDIHKLSCELITMVRFIDTNELFQISDYVKINIRRVNFMLHKVLQKYHNLSTGYIQKWSCELVITVMWNHTIDFFSVRICQVACLCRQTSDFGPHQNQYLSS